MEEVLLEQPVPGTETKVKSRTRNRSALRSKRKRFLKKHATPHTAFKIGYSLAALLLFQFTFLQFALGLYEPSVVLAAPSHAIVQNKLWANVEPEVGLPARLKIPSVKVNAMVRYVGLTHDGYMGVPKLPRDAAWYMLGPKPGERGSAVIAGHVNWWYGATGVFQHLKTLKAGDTIIVQDDSGKDISFVVRETREYHQEDDATDVFFSNDGKAHLNLVTCAGVWDKLTGAYSKRLVVFADKVE